MHSLDPGHLWCVSSSQNRCGYRENEGSFLKEILDKDKTLVTAVFLLSAWFLCKSRQVVGFVCFPGHFNAKIPVFMLIIKLSSSGHLE